MHLDATPWVAPIDAALIAEVAAAIEERCELELTYRDAIVTTSERTVRPYGLLRSDDVWYLAAYCRWRQDDRLEAGGVLLRCGVDDLETFAARLLAVGCRFDVRGPPKLAGAAFAAITERARAVHEGLETVRHDAFGGGERSEVRGVRS